ncbi:MAG: histidinol-phosphate transaminase, partial [Oscillospiraceae bacterium]
MLIKGENAHGGDIYSNKVVLDFSANVSMLGTPIGVKKAIIEATEGLSCYPDPYCRELRKKISEYEQVSYDYIICGNGAADLIFGVANALKPQKALIVSPTFCEYENALQSVGCTVDYHMLKADNGFNITQSLQDQIQKGYDAVFICNPNNPTGQLYDKQSVLAIANLCRENGQLLFLDECFMDLTDNPKDFTLAGEIEKNKNIFILKAFTKSFGMAGVRLGYGLCSNEALLEKMSKMSQVWNVSTLAQKAGCGALDSQNFLNSLREQVAAERQFLYEQLTELGLTVYKGNANFLLFKGEENLY